MHVSVCMHMRVCVCVLVCVNTAANQMIFRALTSHRTLPQPGRFHSDRSTAPSPVTSPQVCDKPGLKPVRIPVKLTAMIHGLKLQHFQKYQLKVSILYCTKTWNSERFLLMVQRTKSFATVTRTESFKFPQFWELKASISMVQFQQYWGLKVLIFQSLENWKLNLYSTFPTALRTESFNFYSTFSIALRTESLNFYSTFSIALRTESFNFYSTFSTALRTESFNFYSTFSAVPRTENFKFRLY